MGSRPWPQGRARQRPRRARCPRFHQSLDHWGPLAPADHHVIRPTVFNRDVSTFDITAGVEATVECSHETGKCAGRRDIEEPDHRRGRLLRVRRERPRHCRTAEQPDELAPLREEFIGQAF